MRNGGQRDEISDYLEDPAGLPQTWGREFFQRGRPAAVGTENRGSPPTTGLSYGVTLAAMWDMYDAENDGADALTSDDHAILEPLWYLPAFDDRGFRGVDFVDWLDGWFCRGQGQTEAVRAILEERRFPYDFPSLDPCPIEKGRIPV